MSELRATVRALAVRLAVAQRIEDVLTPSRPGAEVARAAYAHLAPHGAGAG